MNWTDELAALAMVRTIRSCGTIRPSESEPIDVDLEAQKMIAAVMTDRSWPTAKEIAPEVLDDSL